MHSEDREPTILLPGAPQGWRESLGAQTFSGVALSDYINGGAEAYYAYGFEALAVREFRNDNETRLTIEIYKMDTPENAYGIFSTDAAGEAWDIGADASYGHGLLRFWKGQYFVRIICFPFESSLESTIREIGEKIADAITMESRRPDMLRLVPAAGVVPGTACYFHRQTSLNNIRFLSDQNVLHLNDDVEALTWEESPVDPNARQRKLRHIVVRYSSPSEAERAFDDFTQEYMRVEGAPPLSAEQPGGAFAAADIRGAVVALALDAPSLEAAERAVSSTAMALQLLD